MLNLHFPLPVKFICGFIYSDEKTYLAVKKILEKKFGYIDLESEPIDFNFTDYYIKEMGSPLYRRFISFARPRDASGLLNVKLFCIKLENKLAKNKRRIINIDPGYISDAKLVLATTKDYSHRIYVGKGIFEEVTLLYQGSGFKDLETTYPDFRTQEYKTIFLSVREKYREQIRVYAR